MKNLIKFLALVLFVPVVHAGSAGAGPGGNGAVTVGTVASSITLDLALGGTSLSAAELEVAGTLSSAIDPGRAGRITVEPTSMATVFELVQNATGSLTSTDGNVVSVSVELANNGSGVLIVNRATGQATLIRRS